MDDVYGEYWHVPVCTYASDIDPKYVIWLLTTVGYAGPRTWEWEVVWTARSDKKHAVCFRKQEDAVAFKLKFGL